MLLMQTSPVHLEPLLSLDVFVLTTFTHLKEKPQCTKVRPGAHSELFTEARAFVNFSAN